MIYELVNECVYNADIEFEIRRLLLYMHMYLFIH